MNPTDRNAIAEIIRANVFADERNFRVIDTYLIRAVADYMAQDDRRQHADPNSINPEPFDRQAWVAKAMGEAL